MKLHTVLEYVLVPEYGNKNLNALELQYKSHNDRGQPTVYGYVNYRLFIITLMLTQLNVTNINIVVLSY